MRIPEPDFQILLPHFQPSFLSTGKLCDLAPQSSLSLSLSLDQLIPEFSSGTKCPTLEWKTPACTGQSARLRGGPVSCAELRGLFVLWPYRDIPEQQKKATF
ncbi:hypothetical protein ILYODFUR_019420 [Ilyodon furcidens]|uniref:Uncharacterized protein n=1 Tax=Ilyodon furcidens TaxID=33524 RepID=A0ABV0TMS5_9TELE